MYQGCGVHHTVIGVKGLSEMRDFYRNILGFTRSFADFPAGEYPPLSELIRHPHPRYTGLLFNQEAGGIVLGLTEMIDPPSRPIRRSFLYGDIGVNKITIAVKNVEALFRDQKKEVDFCFEPRSVKLPGWGSYDFVYARDPEGNLLEFVSIPEACGKNKFGGIYSLGVCVTDLKRSTDYYSKYLGFDSEIVEKHSKFSGLVDEISGQNFCQTTSCLLASSHGGGRVELIETQKPRGRSLPFSTRWGDHGFTQVCLNGEEKGNILEIAAFFESEGADFICRPQTMPDGGGFFYMRDPDGIPIEFLVFDRRTAS